MNTSKFGLSSFTLKIIACLLMTLDHFALLFISRGYGAIPISYYILRAVGKISFPIFAYLASESVYKTHDIKLYLLRLFIFSIVLDAFGYLVSLITGITIASNPLIGNAFTDLFMGVLLTYLLKRKDKFSFLAILPIAFEFFSCITISQTYGTLFKSDWGFFSITLFILFFIAKEIASYKCKQDSLKNDIDLESYNNVYLFKYEKIIAAIAIITNALIYYLLYKINYTLPVIPNEYVPIGTYSTLSFIFVLLYNGKRGFDNKFIKYSFYFYYPVHLIILGIISIFVGLLSQFI